MTLFQDVRYAARRLRKAPGFAATAAITIGLGIGATTAIYSVCDALLWKPVPLPGLNTLAVVLEASNDPNDWNPLTGADFEDIRRDNESFSGLAGWSGGLANIVGSGGEPERVSQALVTAQFFD